ncbi:MAG: DUF881 domain-containing protein [Clostridia bacterium]|nr:DUF881 domain-containing protein [Clostridia bacterium]
MKNKMQIGIAIGFMCALLTSTIIIQLNTIEEATKIVGSSYAESELKEEVLRWKEDYERIYKDLENKEKELEKARQDSTSENSRLSKLQQDLDEANKLLGLTEVTGSGIVLTLKDNDVVSSKEIGVDLNEALVHDGDLREIINEMKNSGAEAISINGQRIVSTTAINCGGAIITINNVKVNSPFEIKVIGNVYSLRGIKRPRKLFVNNGRSGDNSNI